MNTRVKQFNQPSALEAVASLDEVRFARRSELASRSALRQARAARQTLPVNAQTKVRALLDTGVRGKGAASAGEQALASPDPVQQEYGQSFYLKPRSTF